MIGGGISGFAVIQNLHGRGIENIILFDHYYKPAAFSNKLESPYVRIGQTAEELLLAIEDLHRRYERIVVFLTADGQVDNLFEVHESIEPYCFLPLNLD